MYPGNMGMNYNQGYGRQLPYHNQNYGRMPMYGNQQFQRPGGYPTPSAFGAQAAMAQNNFRQQGAMNGALRQQPGMSGINPMQGAAGMVGMQGIQGMMPPSPSQGMNPMQGAQQPMGPITFEPYNPSQNATASVPANNMETANMFPAAASSAVSPTGTGLNNPTSGNNGFAPAISDFIQGEKNAALFYLELNRFAKDEYSRSALAQMSDSANNRKLLLSSVYSKMIGQAYSEKDVPIMKSTNLREGLRTAIEIENNTVKEMSALYDQIENSMHLKSLNSVIQKKLADIITLQQIAIYT